MARKSRDTPVARLRDAATHGDGPKFAAAAAAVVGAGALAAKVEIDRRAAQTQAERDREFRLHSGESAAEGIRRIVRSQLDGSVGKLERHRGDEVTDAVHSARKSLKRLRATVRLVRDDIGDERYDTENAFFRDTARHLSDARDSEVMVQTLDALRERYAEELPPHAWAEFHRSLVEDRDRAQARLRRNGEQLDRVIDDLRDAHGRPEAWSFEHRGFDVVAAGLERIYRRGRRELKAARRLRSSEALHEWRKSVKYLRHSAEILEPVAPKRLGRIASGARELGDVLGEDHDLAVLRGIALERTDRFPERDSQERLLDLIDRRRAQLQKRAFKLGKRIYADKPRRFVRSVERRWLRNTSGGETLTV